MPGEAKINCSIVEGLMPSEKIAQVMNADGDIEEVSVSARNISDGRLLAFEIGRDNDRVLVELPRESTSGRWRIWVKTAAVGA